MICVSEQAWHVMEHRTTPIAGFYINLLNFKNVLQEQWVPYTMPISDLYGLAQGIDNVMMEPNIYGRHNAIAHHVRSTLVQAGLTLYPTADYSPSVSVINVPPNINATQLLQNMIEYNGILISGCFGYLKDRGIRIGHMGENCNIKDISETLYALQQALTKQGLLCACDMKESFLPLCSS